MSKVNVKSGIGLPGIVFVVFLVMKLAGIGIVANWSWLWVTSPLWLPLCIILAVLFIWFIGYVLYKSWK